MGDPTQLDPSDRTPLKVLDGILAAHKPYKKDDCIPCGAVIKMGFFFDGFGRNRDHDDPSTSRYSNICRLWEAHRDMRDTRRQKMLNQFWYPFYYSGLGTELNKDAANNEIISAAVKTATAVGKSAANSAKSTAQKVVGVDKVLDLKNAPGKAAKSAALEALDEMSLRPVAKAYAELVAEAKKAPAKVGRVLTMAWDDRWVTRGKAAVRATLFDLKKNPLKAGWSVAKGVFVGVAMDSIPQVRDNAAVSSLFGTGVEDRLHAALKQFEAAYRDAKAKMSTVQRIEVSVFGADRGAVLARVFVNELVRRYKRRRDDDLAIEGDAIEIRFLGLLDAVSSIMAENKLLDFLPLVNMIKQNYGDRPLGVPQAVQKCVHFAAAHELRFYQRLDSLEKTRGDQYLYPGTSEDITGGAPEGSMGFRAELQRVALRDMLNEALMAGAAVDMMEDLSKYKPRTYDKFTLASPISDGKASYKLPDLIAAYRALVPRDKGLNFQAHMQVFLRWLAVRYQDPAFRASITAPAEQKLADWRALLAEKADTQQKLRIEHERLESLPESERSKPANRASFESLLARYKQLEARRQQDLIPTDEALARPVVHVWERIDRESADLVKRMSRQPELEARLKRVQSRDTSMDLPYDPDITGAAEGIVRQEMLTPEQVALVGAWQEGASGKKPLPPQVMALFDLLVHDTMLTSWHDHVLSSTLYFQTRATDTFGKSDLEKEAKQRVEDERNAQRVDELLREANKANTRAAAGS
ncbi:hypothetical protein AYM40_20685 [Paraburkholderia phytofirmans OLGA172]|uniref:Uncharacterized protein n=1 Tax=Paraburkholderia phytofirmans OLGA172 TaxID=1417228 RepID=A0A167W8H7_9BURK|nr:DUF2235 domain-containing protein [Paraburkholderia phytofirmans]ANB74873.1 hypothetical protein AYM40_20685 [Paraburkholderia phytofirmans OLGA172]